MANISDLFPGSAARAQTPTPGYTSNNPAIQSQISQMNQQVLANASPVGRATEIARQAGQVTPQQAEAVKTAAFQAPPSPLVASTSSMARDDLAKKQNFLNQTSQSITDQQARAQALQQQSAQSLQAPASSQDIADSLANRYAEPTEEKKTPLDYLAQVTVDSNKQTQEAYDTYKSKMDQLQNGTLPLSPEQQAQVGAAQSAFNRIKEQQLVANQNFTAGMTKLGISSGRNRYAPEIELGNIKGAIDSGIAKIADIESKAVDSIAKLKQGFREENYNIINSEYDKLTGLIDKKQKAITDMVKVVQDHEDKMRDYNLNVEKFREDQFQSDIKNNMDSDKFTWAQKQDMFSNMMESDKFSYQQKQDNIKNVMDSDKFDWQQKQDIFRNAMDSDKFTWSQKMDVADQALKSDTLDWNKKQDMIRNELDQGKFTYQQKKDLEERSIELEKLALTDNAIAREEWTQAGQPGSFYDFLKSAKLDAKPATADQERNAGFSIRVKTSNDTIGRLEKTFTDRTYLGQNFQGLAPNVLKDSDQQVLEQAERDFVNAILRRESGAAISPSEFKSAQEQYFPQPGDKPENIEAKRLARQNAMNGLVMSSGPALSSEWKDAVLSGKKTYTSVTDIVRDKPEVETQIRDALNKGANYNDILKFYSDDTDSTIPSYVPDSKRPPAFVEPLSMGGKGSSSSNPTGSLSARFESSGNPGVIGYDSTGGWSYGSYQLAHNNAKAFVDQSPYAKEFQGIAFNTPAYRAKWKDVAKKDPEGFETAQKKYIDDTHLGPQKKLLAKAGLDISKASPALKEVIFSTAVQHGPENDVILNALKKVGNNVRDESRLIKAIYDERWSGGRRFASSDEKTKKSVYNRFFGKNGELATALNALKA